MSHTNYTTIQNNCPECHHKQLLRDNIREETYCPQCGIIVQDTTIQGALTDYYKDHNKEKYIRSIWHKIKLTS